MMMTPYPSSNLRLWYEDVLIVAFNLPARICDCGIGVGDLGSAEIEHRDPAIPDERGRQYARCLQRDRHGPMQIQSGYAWVLNHTRKSVTNLEADMKQRAT